MFEMIPRLHNFLKFFDESSMSIFTNRLQPRSMWYNPARAAHFFGRDAEWALMTAREQMLDRVRKSLGRTETSPLVGALPPLDLAGVMPPLAPQDYLSKFEAEWEKVAGVSYTVTSKAELESVFEVILALAETHAVTLSGNPLLAEVGVAELLSGLNKFVTAWDGGTGITGKDSLSDLSRPASPLARALPGSISSWPRAARWC